MHGRLKIKTTAEQEAEKRKEKERKTKRYAEGVAKAFEKRAKGVLDSEALQLTAELLAAVPDNTTMWNFRREILLSMKSGDHGPWEELLPKEMKTVEDCLWKNPKSYGAWHHRTWVMKNMESPPWSTEVALCDKYLKADGRNFHCWDYRRFVVAGSGWKPWDELRYSMDLIRHNLSNYSAWHYRSKLLPVVHPPPPNSPHPVLENALIKELQTVMEAVFTDPCDQSPWFFLKWLVNRQEKTPRILQVGYLHTKGDLGLLTCVLSQPVSKDCVPCIKINGSASDAVLLWYAPSGENYSNVWVAKLELRSDEEHSIAMTLDACSKKTLSLAPGQREAIEWVTSLEACGEELSMTTRSTLEGVKESCHTLDDLDPDNKFVIQNIVNVMWALDSRTHHEEIDHYLTQLQELDPLRNKYYADKKSELAMENALKHHRMTAEIGGKFKLTGCSLTRITFGHLLANVHVVDLSCNDLASIEPLRNLVACRELILDNNYVRDLGPLSKLDFLETLSVKHNKIESVEQLRPIEALPELRELSLSANPICDGEGVEESVREVLGLLESLVIR